MTLQIETAVPAKPHRSWTVADAAELYRTETWGAPYFFINESGHAALNAMDEHSTTIDIAEVVESLRSRGVQFPMLIRFQDILRSQVRRINEAFASAIAEFDYANEYRGVYPIKVNQLHEVVDELLDAGRDYGLGLECGSKAELIAALPQVDGDTLLICNGVKDREMLSLLVGGQQLGQNNIPVIENYAEFTDLKSIAFGAGFVPQMGVRMRLATRGSGRWSESSGVNSKFGLSAAELIRMLDELDAAGLTQRLVLLHCHIGSQIADIQALKQAAKEISRVYVELYQRGCHVRYLDFGGGLGISYGAHDHEAEDDGSINYSLQEYANAIVGSLKEVCDANDVACPVIVTESGRALTAHHSVLIVPVIGTRVKHDPREASVVDESAPEPVQSLQRALEALPRARNQSQLVEAYHVANERLGEVRSLFSLGYITLAQRASAESLYWRLCNDVLAAAEQLGDFPENEHEELLALLTDQYLCDFSVFQSMLDHWAIGQPFPIMPLSRLHEEPTRRGVIVDLTCDSDGKVSHYVSSNYDRRFLPLHRVDNEEAYYLGFFLMGAYEDIVGDAHNLFGRVSEAHVYADPEEPENFWVEKIIPGTAIQDVLAQVQYFPNDLHRRMSELVRAKIREGVVRPTLGMGILDRYMACFAKNTYCDPRDLDREPQT